MNIKQLTFYDLSPCGYNYRERFVTMDEQALGFELLRYTKIDHECSRDWDIRFKLNMNQIKENILIRLRRFKLIRLNLNIILEIRFFRKWNVLSIHILIGFNQSLLRIFYISTSFKNSLITTELQLLVKPKLILGPQFF